MSSSNVYPGIFTPNAETLCFACNGATWGVINFEQLLAPIDADKANELMHITRCDRCASRIDANHLDANLLGAFRDLARASGLDVRLEQTGGMNVNASLELRGEYYLFFVDEGACAAGSEDGIGCGVFSRYDDDWGWQGEDMVDSWTDNSPRAAVARLVRIRDNGRESFK